VLPTHYITAARSNALKKVAVWQIATSKTGLSRLTETDFSEESATGKITVVI
jgi:hypothetical protein